MLTVGLYSLRIRVKSELKHSRPHSDRIAYAVQPLETTSWLSTDRECWLLTIMETSQNLSTIYEVERTRLMRIYHLLRRFGQLLRLVDYSTNVR